jgi:hypothetical protein
MGLAGAARATATGWVATDAGDANVVTIGCATATD